MLLSIQKEVSQPEQQDLELYIVNNSSIADSIVNKVKRLCRPKQINGCALL